ncbi:MAG: SGNH/GDSL hydrolase family protein [Bacilli bacterium]|nr:SGNH/GDSL hydrolase family protein [Bacilli bacterium]
MNNKLIYLAKNYDLVVGDKFELFYRGIIKSMNPYKYYIYVNCPKGRPFPRYYTFTPSVDDCGDYPLTVSLYDDYHNLIETATTNLHVVNPIKPNKKLNILCFGDSLTFNGVWPYEGFRRFTKQEGEPVGLGFSETLNFIGTMKKEEVGYEGYGGWQWRHFVKNEAVSTTSSVWVEVEEHKLDENDQHSVWKSNNLLWVLESIENNKLKFKRGVGNYSCLPTIGDSFENVEGGIHKDDISVKKFYFEKGNPFYDESIDGPNFKKYCVDNGFEGIDYVYILLTWNGQYVPYNNDFSHYEPFIKSILDRIHVDYPEALVRLIGVQSPSIDGGIASNYGASGPYSDVFGDLTTVYNYNKYLEELVSDEKYSSYCRYIDMKAQFDVEYNMPSTLMKVNNRSDDVERIGTNGVHPTMAGYLQIGDVFYRALVADIEKNNK